MADVELVIKVPGELYEAYKGKPPMLGDAGMDMIAQAIANGTPLHKGHGRLIDENKLLENLKESANHHANNSREESLLYRDRVIVSEQPTIIEADKESEE